MLSSWIVSALLTTVVAAIGWMRGSWVIQHGPHLTFHDAQRVYRLTVVLLTAACAGVIWLSWLALENWIITIIITDCVVIGGYLLRTYTWFAYSARYRQATLETGSDASFEGAM